MRSDFGKGFSYCLGLFLAHAEKFGEIRRNKELKVGSEMWFNASSDHFYEIQTEHLPKHLKKRVEVLASKCLIWDHSFSSENSSTWEDVDWAIQEAKDILRLYDNYNKIKTCKGSWE